MNILTLIVFLPTIGALLCLFVPKGQVRSVAVAASLVTLIVSLGLFPTFLHDGIGGGHPGGIRLTIWVVASRYPGGLDQGGELHDRILPWCGRSQFPADHPDDFHSLPRLSGELELPISGRSIGVCGPTSSCFCSWKRGCWEYSSRWTSSCSTCSGSDAAAHVLPDRRVGRAEARVRGNQVLPVHAGGLGADVGGIGGRCSCTAGRGWRGRRAGRQRYRPGVEITQGTFDLIELATNEVIQKPLHPL